MAAETKSELKETIVVNYCCRICSYIISSGNRCNCQNQLIVVGNKFVAKFPQHVILLNADMIPTRLSDDEKAHDLSKDYCSLYHKPIWFYNAVDRHVGILNPSKVEIKNVPIGGIEKMDNTFRPDPIPVIKFSIKNIAIELTGIPKDKAIVADNYHGLLLILSGYTNVYTPDTSEPSLVIDTADHITVRRIIHIVK